MEKRHGPQTDHVFIYLNNVQNIFLCYILGKICDGRESNIQFTA